MQRARVGHGNSAEVEMQTAVAPMEKHEGVLDAGPYVDRGWYVVVDIPHRRSKSLPSVLRKARKNPGFMKLMDERGMLFYRVVFFRSNACDLLDLMDDMKQWSDVRVFLKGQEEAAGRLSGLRCYCRQMREARRYWYLRCPMLCGDELDVDFPNYIGCGQNRIWLSWQDADYHVFSSTHWFDYGDLNGVTLSVDKPLMQTRLDESIDYAAFCPVYSREFLDKMLARLPDSFAIGEGTQWVAMKEKLGEDWYYYHTSFSSLPMLRPSSKKAYDRLMAELFKGWRSQLPVPNTGERELSDKTGRSVDAD